MHTLERHRLTIAFVLLAVVALIVVLVRASPWTVHDGRLARWTAPVVSADGTQVTVTYTVDGCIRDADAATAEDPDAVTITVLVRDPAGTDCGRSAEARTATVTLDEPLGDRQLRDGAAD